jgi:hypothetical protein
MRKISAGLLPQSYREELERERDNDYVLGNDAGLDQKSVRAKVVSNKNKYYYENGFNKRIVGAKMVQIINSNAFEKIMLGLVVLNTIAMGIATTDLVTTDELVRKIFTYLDYAFLTTFSIELVLSILLNGIDFFDSRWRFFDLFVIIMSWAYPTLLVIRGFRALALMSNLQSERVKKIMLVLESALPIFASAFVLLALILYVAAVIFTDLFGDIGNGDGDGADDDDGGLTEDYFGDIAKSLFTVFHILTGADWPDIAREIGLERAGVPFVALISGTIFIMVELAVAALCKCFETMKAVGIIQSPSLSRSHTSRVKSTPIPTPIQCTEENIASASKQERMAQIEKMMDRLLSETSSETSHIQYAPSPIQSERNHIPSAPSHIPSAPTDEITPIVLPKSGVCLNEISDTQALPSRHCRSMVTISPPTAKRISEEWYERGRISEEWYDKLALSFEKQSVKSDEMRLASYNCFPQRVEEMCNTFVNNERFKITIIYLIVLNSITLGIATCDFLNHYSGTRTALNIVDFILLLIFTIELIAQFGCRGMSFLQVGWLKFDLVVIIASWMIIVSQTASFYKSGWWTKFDLLVIIASWIMPTLKVARAFRVFRLFSRIPFMRHIVVALLIVAPKLGISAAAISLLFYVFGVLFTDMFKELKLSEDYFSGLNNTLFTLFQCMTISGWPSIAREIMAAGYGWAWIPFISWIILSKFTLIQLSIAILCQSLSRVKVFHDHEESDDGEIGASSSRIDADDIARLEVKLELLSENIDFMMSSRIMKENSNSNANNIPSS